MNLPEVRRKEGKGVLRGGTVEAPEAVRFLSAIAAHPHGDTGSARDFRLDLVFVTLAEDEKVSTSDNNDWRAVSFAQVAAPEDFPQSLSSTSFANPRIFSRAAGSWSRRSIFKIDFFKSSNRAVEFFEGLRGNNFCAKFVVCFWGKPQGPFLVRRPRFAGRLSCLTLFHELELGRRVS